MNENEVSKLPRIVPTNANPEKLEALPESESVKPSFREETASKIAFWLIGLLCGTIILQYFFLFLIDDTSKQTLMMDAFDKIMTILATLVGGAVAYYFATGKSSED